MKLKQYKVNTKLVQDYMLAHCLDVENMSQLCDMSVRTFKAVINNRRPVDAKQMLKLSVVLKRPIRELLLEK